MSSGPVTRISGLLSDVAAEARSLLHETRHHRPAPPKEGLVLDVGSGQAPHPRADVVADKYLVDNFERSAGDAFDLSRPVVVADAQALPFADGTFDYVIASHMLEHAPDPVAMAAEFARVGRAGFIQVPSRESDLVYGWPFHPWLIDLEGTTLVFHPKPDLEVPGGPTVHAAFHESLLNRAAFRAHRSRWHHSVRWTGHVDVRVEGDREAHHQASLDLRGTLEMLRDLGARGGLRPLPPAVRDALRCPACGGGLQLTDERATCAACGTAYPVAGGVPVLLAEAVPASA
jgi:hypothetical protein